MADTTPVPDGNGTPERVAYDLMTYIRFQANAKGFSVKHSTNGILDLYAECLHAAKGSRVYHQQED